MPSFGIDKALRRAARQGAAEAVVTRPGEQALAEQAAKQAAAKEAEELAKQAKGPGRPRRGRPKRENAAATAVDPEGAPITPKPAEEPPAPKPLEDQPATQPAANVPEQNAPVVRDPNDPVAQKAQALDEAKIDDFDLDAEHQPNFDVINTTDDIKALIAEISQQNATKINAARRETITHEQLQGLASDLDVRSDVIAQVLGREAGGTLNAETILAARQVLHASAARLKEMAGKINRGEATAVDRVKFARQLQFHNEYQTQFMGARAEAGRALNAFGIPTNMDEGLATRIDEIMQATGGNIEQLAKAIEAAPDVRGVTKIAKAGLFVRAGRAAIGFVNRLFVNGILSGPQTHIVNSMGNALYMAMYLTERAVAARLGKFLPGTDHVEVGEVLASLHGIVQATRDAFRIAAMTARTGRTIDDMLKFDTQTVETLAHLPELDKPYLGRVITIADSLVDAPTRRVMASQDEFFKTLAYRAEVERQAFLHLRNQVAAGVVKTPDDARRVVREFMENPPEQAQEAAEAWARDMTFQTPLGPTGQKAQAFLRSVPVLTLIAPFIKTPVNIFKLAVHRSPLAIASAKFWKDVRAGGPARDMALTRFAMGSATAVLIGMMAVNDEITGAGPSNPEARMLWEAKGKRPYSIKVTNPVTGETEWHSYARMEPLASVIGIVADTVEIQAYLMADAPTDELKTDDQRMNQLAGAIITGIMNNTGNKTFMKGIADFVELLSDPSRNWNTYKNQMGVSLAVPYSGLLRNMRNVQDPLLREAWTLRDKIADTVPGYSENLPPRRGLFGELREKNSGSLLGVLSPMPESAEKSDRVIAHVQDLMDETKLVPLTMPAKDIDGMRLNAREYERLVRISRREPIFNGETMTFKEKLEEVIDSDVYQNATPTMKVELLKNVQHSADAAARAILERDDVEFANRIEAFRSRRNLIRFDQ